MLPSGGHSDIVAYGKFNVYNLASQLLKTPHDIERLLINNPSTGTKKFAEVQQLFYLFKISHFHPLFTAVCEYTSLF